MSFNFSSGTLQGQSFLLINMNTINNNPNNNSKIEEEVRKEVVDLCSNFPIYKHLG